jgi:outer membrane protein OmpA-like peptidoglycan-associated protein
MKPYFIVLLIVLTTFSTFSQSDDAISGHLADCEGALELLTSGSYSTKFTGEIGKKTDLVGYADAMFLSENAIWLSFTAKSAGQFYFEAKIPKGELQLIVFKGNKKSLCETVEKGSVNRIGQIQVREGDTIRIAKTENESLPPISLEQGETVFLALLAQEKSTEILSYNVVFTGTSVPQVEKQIVDTRVDNYSPMVHISVRDAETKQPIVASVVVEGVKDVTAAYYGTDILATVTRSGKASIKCDAKGYFFIDKIESLTNKYKQEITIYMDPIDKGKSFQLDEIEFRAGTDQFTDGALPKLIRLRDFMAMNAEIAIEIHGHVYAVGPNTPSSQRMSDERAKSVMRYLIENGIQKDRLSTKGFGNSKPIYPKPKNEQEIQANRRVEVMVK